MSFFAGERPIIEAVRTLDSVHGIAYQFFSDDWTVKLTYGDKIKFITGYGLDFNTQAAAQNAKDKVVAYQLMADNDLPAIPHILLSHMLQPQVDAQLLGKLIASYQNLVIKPTQGGGGRMVARFNNVTDVLEFAKSHEVPSWCAAPFVDIRSEMRLVIFNESVILAFVKTEPAIQKNLAMFNLSMGAKPSVVEANNIPSDLKQLAITATKTLGLKLAAIDIAFNLSGQPSILEVNASFSLDHFSASSPANHDLAIKLYQDLIVKLF